MQRKDHRWISLWVLLTLWPSAVWGVQPLGTAFTYQGKAVLNGVPVDGTCDMRFRLFDDPAGGSQIGPDLLGLVDVHAGLFMVEVDFGAGAFNGDARWLEIALSCPNGGALTTLTPRQPVTPAPYALYATNAWHTTGNAGTTPGTHYAGTSDNVDFVIGTNGAERARVTALGDLGIGINVPTAKVDVLNESRGNSLIVRRSTVGASDLLANSLGQVIVGDPAGTLAKLTVNSAAGEDAFRVRVDGTTHLMVAQDGQVGVGTSTPTARLQVNPRTGEDRFAVGASTGNTTDLVVNSNGEVAVGDPAGVLAKLAVNSAAGQDAFRVRVDGTTHFMVAQDGQIGVGSSTPTSRLEINPRTGENRFAVNAAAGNTTDLLVDDGGNVVVGAPTGAAAQLTVNGTAEDALRVRTDGSTRFLVAADGKIGVHTSVPTATFHVNPPAGAAGFIVEQPNSAIPAITVDSGGDVTIGQVVNTIALLNVNAPSGQNPLAVKVQGTTEVMVNSAGNLGVGTVNPTAPIHVTGGADASLTGGGNIICGDTTGGNIVIDGNEIMARDNQIAAVLHLNAAGGPVAIGGQGLAIPNDAALAVDGKVLCEELEVKLSGDWPDYVFGEGYELTPLPELEEKIRKTGHLPDMPSAEAVEKEGIAVGDMQKRLLQKVEELTLHVIALDKQNRSMQQENEELRRRLASLEQAVR